MTLTRWITLLLLSLCVAGCDILEEVFLPDNTSQPPPMPVESEPPPLYFLIGHVAMPMDRGSYCWVTGEDGICKDVFPPSYPEEMHLWVIGNTMELRFDLPLPDTVTATLHPGSDLMAVATDIIAEAEMDENGRVLVTVPENLDGDFVLAVFATWVENDRPYGDASYTTPVRFGE